MQLNLFSEEYITTVAKKYSLSNEEAKTIVKNLVKEIDPNIDTRDPITLNYPVKKVNCSKQIVFTDEINLEFFQVKIVISESEGKFYNALDFWIYSLEKGEFLYTHGCHWCLKRSKERGDDFLTLEGSFKDLKDFLVLVLGNYLEMGSFTKNQKRDFSQALTWIRGINI